MDESQAAVKSACVSLRNINRRWIRSRSEKRVEWTTVYSEKRATDALITASGRLPLDRSELNRLLHLACLDAGSANAAAPHRSVFNHADALEIGIPAAFREVMRMALSVPDQRLFTADFTTSGHKMFSAEILI